MLEQDQVARVIEAALLASEQPLTVERLQALFGADEADRQTLRDALAQLEEDCRERGYELKQVASGYRFQVRQELSPWISRMWEERPPRYSRALMETLALIAYRQPVTRGDIEEVRGVAVGSNIVRTLLEREWVRVVGYKEVPGRPAMYATTKAFLDYFNLKSLDELPPLAEIRALTEPHVDELAQAGPEYAEGLPAPEPNAESEEGEDEKEGEDGGSQGDDKKSTRESDSDDRADDQVAEVNGDISTEAAVDADGGANIEAQVEDAEEGKAAVKGDTQATGNEASSDAPASNSNGHDAGDTGDENGVGGHASEIVHDEPARDAGTRSTGSA